MKTNDLSRSDWRAAVTGSILSWTGEKALLASPPLRMVKESAPNSPASGKRVKVSTTELISSTDSVSKATTFG